MNRMHRVLLNLFISLCTLPAASAQEITILVNPFANNSNHKYDWISEGMNATAISDLSKVDSVQVISQRERDSAMEELKLSLSGLIDENKALEIGKWQGAQYILSGSYQVAGNRIRANARMIDIENGTVVISVKEDGTIDRIFEFQDGIILSLLNEADRINLGGADWHSALQDYKIISLTASRPEFSAYEEFSAGYRLRSINPPKALEHYLKALEIEPDYPNALIAAGSAVISVSRDYEKGQEYYSRAKTIIASEGDENTARMAELLIAEAHLAVQLNQYQKAENFLDAAAGILEIIGGHNLIRSSLEYRYGELFAAKGNYTSSLSHYQKSAELQNVPENRFSPNLVRISIAQGQTLRKAGKLDSAIKKYNETVAYIKKYSKTGSYLYADLIFNRGTAFKEKGLTDKALRDYLDARDLYRKLGLDCSTNYFIFLGNLGGLLGMKKEWEKAAEAFMEAVRIAEKTGDTKNPDYPAYIYMEGLCLYIKGDRQKAGPLFRKSYNIFTDLKLYGDTRDSALKYARGTGY